MVSEQKGEVTRRNVQKNDRAHDRGEESFASRGRPN